MNFTIIEPSVEYIKQENIIDHVVKCARVCYDSLNGDNDKLYQNLIKKGHLSMLRHATRYFKIPISEAYLVLKYSILFSSYTQIYEDYEHYYFVVNEQYAYENPLGILKDYEIPEKLVPFNYRRFTFKLGTSIAVSRELNRVSPNNIAERSTRYIDYTRSKYDNIPISKPYWYKGDNSGAEMAYRGILENISSYYKILRDRGLKAEEARGILPLDTYTEVIYTYSYQEWQEIFRKRIDNETGRSHPDATNICKMIKDELNKQRGLSNKS